MDTNLENSLTDVSTFLVDLASDTPAPGGGASAAVIGAIACAQSAMVAGLSLQNSTVQKNASRVATLTRLRTLFEALQEQFMSSVVADAQAYTQLSAVFKMPRATSEQAEKRHMLLQKHLLFATEPPFEVLKRTQESLTAVAELAECASRMTRTDLIVAALALKASARGGEAMVRANTMYLSDSKEAKALDAKAHELAQSADSLSQEIFLTIRTSQDEPGSCT